jgi:hypothetical protein
VSRLSNKSVLLRVSPEHVSGTLRRGWWLTRTLATAGHACDTSTDVDNRSTPPAADDTLAEPIESVLHELSQSSSLTNARLHVELADALLHLDVVPGEFAGTSERQLAAIASACVEELLGDSARDHEVRWQLLPDDGHLLIGAIAHDLLQSLADTARRHRLLLRTVQPDFCVQWNRHARALAGESVVFAVAASCEAVVAQVNHGSIWQLSRGAWLDTLETPGVTRSRVRQLMCGLGLEPTATAGALDQRVDRLLACGGLVSEQQSAFVLVAPPLSNTAVSARWRVFDVEGAAR